MDNKVIIIIIGMAAVTYFPRLVPLIAISKIKLPEVVERWLKFIPVAVFTSLIFPSVLLVNDKISIGFGNMHIWAGLICLIVIMKTRNLSMTVAAGIIAILIFNLL